MLILSFQLYAIQRKVDESSVASDLVSAFGAG